MECRVDRASRGAAEEPCVCWLATAVRTGNPAPHLVCLLSCDHVLVSFSVSLSLYHLFVITDMISVTSIRKLGCDYSIGFSVYP